MCQHRFHQQGVSLLQAQLLTADKDGDCDCDHLHAKASATHGKQWIAGFIMLLSALSCSSQTSQRKAQPYRAFPVSFSGVLHACLVIMS